VLVTLPFNKLPTLSLCPAEKGIETYLWMFCKCLSFHALSLCPAEKGIETRHRASIITHQAAYL